MARPSSDPPDLGSDADDAEALRYAIALSLQEEGNGSATPSTSAKPAASPSRGPHPAPAPSGLFSLDRKKMEEQRLQRLAKRRRESSTDDDVVEVPPPKKKPPPGPQLSGTEATSSTAAPFPNGAVKRTWARGYSRSSDDIKIDEIFQKDQLQLAILSSFQWDEDWMLTKLDITKTNLLLVAFAADNAQKEAMRANVPPSIKFCFPPMNGPGSMHSKLQLLKFPGYLRIVIPTGNLVPYDWGETGVMENMVFLIDLPRCSNSIEHRPTMFSNELRRFLEATGIDDKMVDSLSNYDFSRTAHLGFVYSIPGVHLDESRKRVGYCGLGSSVAALGLATTEPVEVDLVCASLGAVTCDLAGAIYNACQGDDGMKEFAARKPASKSAGTPKLLRERLRIYFPAGKTVSSSRGGRGAAGTICIQAKWWRAPNFPRELVRDCVNNRDGLLMHTKAIYVRKTRRGGAGGDGGTRSGIGVEEEGRQRAGWAYVGSANLSESAWGRVVKDRGSGKAKMSCRNWECGVVVPIPNARPAGEETDAAGKAEGMGIFGPTIPVPMQTPGREYGPQEEPWFYLEA